MNTIHSAGRLPKITGIIVLSSLIICGLNARVWSADKKAEAPKKSAAATVNKKLSGAELYTMHCNRCHPERYATERTAAQWKTLMLHMRVRAGLPANQAKAILKYLEEDAGK